MGDRIDFFILAEASFFLLESQIGILLVLLENTQYFNMFLFWLYNSISKYIVSFFFVIFLLIYPLVI